MQFPLPLSEIPQDFDALDISPPPAPAKTYFTKEEILAPCHPYAKPPVVPEATAWVLLAACVPMAGVLIAEPLWKALRAWKRPQYTLQHLLVLSFALAGALLGGVGFWQANEAEKTPMAILAWSKEFPKFGGHDLWITCHLFSDKSETRKLSVYLKDQDRYRHERTDYCYWGARFADPTCFRYYQDGFDLDVLVLTVNYMAVSSVNIEENAFYLDEFGQLKKIQVEDAQAGAERIIQRKANEELSRCDWYFLFEGNLQFEYGVRVSCRNRARAGYYSVLGRYKLIRYAGDLRFVVTEAHRECAGEGPYVAQLFELANYR